MHGVEPVPRASEGGDGRLLGCDADTKAVPLERVGARADAVDWTGNDSKPELRHRQALPETADHDDVVREAEGGGEAGVAPQRSLVGLVRDDEEAALRGARDDGGDVLPRGDVAGRVAGIAQEHHRRARPDRALDGLGVPAPAVCLRPVHVDRDAAGRTDRAVEEEARCRHDDLVPGSQQRAHADAERVHGAVRDERSRVSGSTLRPVDRSSSRRVCLSQRCEAAGRRCGHRPAEYGGDGLDHVVRERRRGRAVERHRLDACSMRRPEPSLGLVGREAAGARHGAITGSNTCEGYRLVCRTVWWATSIRVPVRRPHRC